MLKRLADCGHIVVLDEEEASRPTRAQVAIVVWLGTSRADRQQFKGTSISDLKSHERSFWCLVCYWADGGISENLDSELHRVDAK